MPFVAAGAPAPFIPSHGDGLQSGPPSEVILFIPNAHCPSCTTHILALLSNLPLPLADPTVSYLTKRLSFTLPPDAAREPAVRQVRRALEDAGFEVVRPETGEEDGLDLGDGGSSVRASEDGRGGLLAKLAWATSGGSRRSDAQRKEDGRRALHLANCLECQRAAAAAAGTPAHASATGNDGFGGGAEAFELRVDRPRAARLVETTFSVEGMFCAACTKTLTDTLTAHPAVTAAAVLLLANSAKVTHDAHRASAEELKEVIEETGYGAEIVQSLEVGQPEKAGARSVKTTWSIEGMTCASCAASITKALSTLPQVHSSVISPLQGSAVIEHNAALPLDALKEAIEDTGFGAEWISTAPLDQAQAAGADASGRDAREVRVKVDGLYCGSCVAKVNATLDGLQQSGVLRSWTPVSLKAPLTTVSYVPSSSFTLRHLLADLAALDAAFTAAPFAPPSVSARARAIQAREARVLRAHFAVAFAAAVPTFVIAIVGMTLLPRGHAFRQYWEEPVWGGAGRGTVVLWALATVVQFGVGRIFYRRALRPLFSLLRRRPSAQRTKTWSWRVLLSFGSMDLLVAMSTTTAYVASLGMLGVDVHSHRMEMDEEKTMTLFDSSVFLIFFILCGRVLEAWAKSRTGDAIALLGTLRPDTALLVTLAAEGEADGGEEAMEEELRKVHTSSTTNTLLPHGAKHSLAYAFSTAASSLGSFTTSEIPVAHLELGDLLLVRPGALPPADGTVLRGQTAFDEASLTGEARAVPKRPGDELLTGTVNVGKKAVVMRVERLGEETTIERVGRAVEGAMSSKSKVEEVAEMVTGVFVPCVVYFALVVLTVWLIIALATDIIPDAWIKPAPAHPSSGDRAFFAVEFFIAVLVVACPCGIGLAAPTAAAVGLGLAARQGVLAQGGGSAFQAATKVDTIVFDKTGTLTTGKPSVTDFDYALQSFNAANNLKENEGRQFLLSALRDLEAQSSHPLASALQAFAADQLALLPSPSFGGGGPVSTGSTEEVVGRGLKAVVTLGKPAAARFEVCVGNEALLTSVGADLPPSAATLVQNWKEGAKSVVFFAARPLSAAGAGAYVVCASFAIADPPRPEAKETIEKLQKAGKEVWLCSGDNEVTARAVAKQVGISEHCVVAGVLPEGKAEHINALKGGRGPQSDGLVLFCGDGLNDAVALAAADVGVAMGSGSQVSVVSADFVLLNSSLDSLHALLHISRRVLNRTKVNFFWAILFNAVCLPLAAGVFYAAGRTKLAPVWSALAMALSSVSVVTSSLALRWGL